MFPSDPGSFINDYSSGGFSWYPNYQVVLQGENWVNPVYNNTYYMDWPFSAGCGDNYLSVIHPTEDRDYHWEDGWELLWMNLGRLPNGTPIDEKPPGSWNAFNEEPRPNNAPYFILYNRYRGTVRLFANLLFDDITDWDNVKVKLAFDYASSFDKNVSGVFRHVAGYDQALDQPTKVSQLSSPVVYDLPGYGCWMVVDFQVGYDPCQCMFPTKIDLIFTVTNTLNVDYLVRTIAVEKDLDKLNFDDNRFFQSMVDDQGNFAEPGNYMYRTMNDLLEDYREALRKYEEELEDYNSFENILTRDLLSMVSVVLAGGISNWMIPTGAIASFILKKKNELYGFSKNANYETPKSDKDQADAWAKDLQNAAKKTLADGFDYLSTSLTVSEKPQRPQMPVATFNEGRVVGTIQDNTEIRAKGLFVPGTVPTAPFYSGIPPAQDMRASNFPAYNNVMGQFALLKTPRLRVYEKPIEVESIDLRRYPDKLPEGRPEAWYFDSISSVKEIQFQVIDGLEYVLNPAIDWDMDKTRIHFALQIEFDMETGGYPYYENLRTRTDLPESNFSLTHRINEDNGDMTAVVTSQYYDIRDVDRVLFKLGLKNSAVFNPVAPSHPGEVWADLFKSQPRIKIIKLKIVADMYFQQIGYNGEQVTSFQVFTFKLFDAANGHTLANSLLAGGGIPATDDSWALYRVGTQRVSGIISPGDPMVFEQVGNTLFIRAEEVQVTGETGPAPGYNLVLEGMFKTSVLEEGKLLPGTRMYTRDFYNANDRLPIPVDGMFYSSYCNNDYKANELTPQAKMLFEKELERRRKNAQLSVRVQPNPASTSISIHLENLLDEPSEVVLRLTDLTGRCVKEETVPYETETLHLELPQLATGVYLLQTSAGDLTSVNKVMVRQ